MQRRRDVGVVEGPGTRVPGAAARSAARSWACSRTPANACATVSRSRGCASRDRGLPVSVVGWGTAVPDGRVTNADLEATRRHERRVDRRAHRHPRAPHRGAGRDHRDARDRGRAPTRSSAPGSSPDRHRPARSSRPRRPSSRSPTPARSSARRSACTAGRSTSNAACAGFVYELVVGASMLQHGLRPRADRRRRDAEPHHRPRRPRHRRSSSATAPRAAVLAPSTGRRPGSSPGTSAATARPPACSRSPPAAAACRRRAETVADARALPEDGGPGGVPARGARRRRLGARSTLERAGVGVDDVAWFVPHQANVPHHRSRGASGSASRPSARS